MHFALNWAEHIHVCKALKKSIQFLVYTCVASDPSVVIFGYEMMTNFSQNCKITGGTNHITAPIFKPTYDQKPEAFFGGA